MAYTVNKTDGTILSTVSDGTIDTTTDIVLIGKNYSGYGEFQNENYVKLLENFANTSAPGSPITGQVWYDTTNSSLKVYNGTTFKNISSTTVSATTPSGAVTGDLWWDTTNAQLKVYDGSAFVIVGPPYSASQGKSGALVETVTDNGASDHVTIGLYTNGTQVGIISKDTEFTPQTSITGFSTVKPGLQLSSTVSGVKLQGTATDSDALGGITSANFLRSNASDSTSGVLSILNDTGVVVGVDSDLTIGVSGTNVQVKNVTSDGDILFNVNDGGVDTLAMTIDGATSRVLLAGDPTVSLGAATKAYVDTQVSGVSGSSITVNDTSVAITDTGANGQVLTTVDGVAKITTLSAQTTFAQPIAMGTNRITGVGDPVSGQDVATKTYVDASGSSAGKHTMWIPVAAMKPTVSNGCSIHTEVETTSGRPDMQVLDFDASSDEHAQFQIAFPKSWNEGTVTFQTFWTTAATDTDGVAWALQGVAVSDNDTINATYGTAVVVTDDALGAANDLCVTSESGNITIAGTPAEGDVCYFRIFRDVSDANDDMTEDARLLGIKLFFTTDAANDA